MHISTLLKRPLVFIWFPGPVPLMTQVPRTFDYLLNTVVNATHILQRGAVCGYYCHQSGQSRPWLAWLFCISHWLLMEFFFFFFFFQLNRSGVNHSAQIVSKSVEMTASVGQHHAAHQSTGMANQISIFFWDLLDFCRAFRRWVCIFFFFHYYSSFGPLRWQEVTQ